MDIIVTAFLDALSLSTFLPVVLGVVIGIVIGAIPGLNAPMAIAVAIPLTFTMAPLAAIGLLVGVMKGGGFGGAIGAILLNTPGEPHSAATALDGHPMAKSGKPRRALQTALYSSVVGDSCSDLVLILLAPTLAIFALKAGPVELAAILILSLTLIASLSGRSLAKGIFAAALGAFLATVGVDPETAAPRFTFGMVELFDGLPLAAVAIGVLAVPEIFQRLQDGRERARPAKVSADSAGQDSLPFREFLTLRVPVLRGAGIGTAIGALPGLGTTLAAFLSYAATKRFSAAPDKLGTGATEGIAATESANSAVSGANLIPLLTLGIPGNLTAALLVGAFLIHGVTPGPMIFQRDAQLIYGLFAAMIMANVMVLLVGSLGLRVFALIVKVPPYVIYPVVLLLCVVGIYISQGGIFAVWLMLGFAVLGFVMQRLEISVVCFIIGLVLGPMIELSIRQSVILLSRSPAAILEHPFALCLFAATPFVAWILVRDRKRLSDG
ncbi:tripartite tricarboxylate transporter permease [Mameliella sediminis]|uniref:tripartite tricarboxylate transporter permease n=1 Tax=Mameliella sediminis TaxID=2836866 RepID=UPI001C468FA7|nr:tripartite tricarboxylate transporter permease [Mameliella sediminis]MBV7395754.1 tripartite tricarboxylate transporter permease [Mameliella sediminis]MBY6115295.1 tripartite tricarboxylate transporter permease [Antarctobacter heliothermus]MBY6144640.1 tripartite tricarboxylate transporter permease [Mameliella alba]MCA0956104.1 tripartite tricarboxylate transporter permease [Mameliella alba]